MKLKLINLNKKKKKKEVENANSDRELDNKIAEIKENQSIQHIIIDFSCINYIDSMGVNAILQVNILLIILFKL
jgi:anti-anti-sigma regulatory factor